MKYETLACSYTRNDDKMNSVIRYPQIYGLEDLSRQDCINLILREEALKVFNYYKDLDRFLTLDISYTVTASNPCVLSVQYFGYGMVDGSAHPVNLFYTTNIDIRTCARLRLRDLIDIDQDFVDKFLYGGFTPVNPDQSAVLQYLTSDMVWRYFEGADSMDDIGTESQTDTFSYFTKDSFGVSIGVSHALGDHTEFEIKYRDIPNNINEKCGIWDCF